MADSMSEHSERSRPPGSRATAGEPDAVGSAGGAPGEKMAVTPIDVARIKKDYPLLQQQVYGKRIVYLDSAASSEKPQAVLDAMDEVYNTYYANVHRSVYKIAAESTERYEEARGKIAAFIGAPSPSNIVFGKNVTEVINLVAYSWGRAHLREGDAVV